MKLPNSRKAILDERKVREYLLSPSHPIGRFKARFFSSLGFTAENWQDLTAALMQIATAGDAELVEESRHGRKYLILGTLTGPTGTTGDVRTVWFIRSGDDAPRLVTVYPR